MLATIQKIANECFYTSNKVKFVTNLYRVLRSRGINACVVNDRYIEVGNFLYEFINHRADWSYEVKEYQIKKATLINF